MRPFVYLAPKVVRLGQKWLWDVMSPANRMRLIEAVVKKVIVNEPENEVTVMLNDLGAPDRQDDRTDEAEAGEAVPATAAMEASP